MQNFSTLVLGPASESKLYQALALAITGQGENLQRNPRRLVGEVACGEGKKAWDMTVGKTPFRVVISDNGNTDIAKGNILFVRFDKNQRTHTMKCVKALFGNCTLMISGRVMPERMHQFANQIVADLVANGRSDKYLPSDNPNKKPRHPSRERDRNARRRDRYYNLA